MATSLIEVGSGYDVSLLTVYTLWVQKHLLVALRYRERTQGILIASLYELTTPGRARLFYLRHLSLGVVSAALN